MAIAVVPKFNKAYLDKIAKEHLEKIEKAVLLVLRRVGEQFIRDARNTKTYKDQTGNLRSSIGYVILKNGKQVEGSFGSKSVGKQAAKAAIAEVAKQYPKGFALIGVAGMSYAAAVEARGYDVITNASDAAAELLKELMSKVGKRASRLQL
jgi:hypothetical protein